MTWRDELEAYGRSLSSSPDVWPPKIEISDRDFTRIIKAGEIPSDHAEVFRHVLLGALAKAVHADRKVNLRRTKKQWLKIFFDAETKLHNFMQSLKNDDFILLYLLADPCSADPAARKADRETRRVLRSEAGRDLDGLERIADRLATMIKEVEYLPEKKGSNNSATFFRHLIRALERYWRGALRREIDGTQQCRFRLLMDAVFRYTARGQVSPDTLTKRLKTHLAGGK